MFHKFSYWWIRRTLYIPRFGGVLQELGILLGGVSDCEELVGVTHRRWWGYSLKVTPLRLFDVPEDLKVHELPSDEV